MRYLTFLFVLLFQANTSFAQWENLNTGIVDNLTGIVFVQNNGITCGEHGIYYTTDEGVGPASWTRFQITDNSANALIYENTTFTYCYTREVNTTNTATVYFCGQNRINNTAVLLQIAIPTLSYQFRYTGAPNSKLNKIDFNYGNGSAFSKYVAVGDNGLVLGFTDTTLVEYNTGINENILSVKGDNSAVFEYGTLGKLKRAEFLTSSIHHIGELSVPNVPIKDIYKPFSVGNDNLMYTSYLGPATITNNSYHDIPLNANCVYKLLTSQVFVGTTNGIYRAAYNVSNFQNTPLELQPSSSGFSINEIWKQNGNQYTYACGNNGVILRTSDNGGATQPYIKMTVNGGCYLASTAFSAITGSADQANWYANNQLIHSGLGNFNYTFPGPGLYTIRLDIQNSEGGQNSVSKDIYLATQPVIDKVIALSDNILCKQESIQIQIQDAEPNVIYTLRKEGEPTSNYGESAVATGGNLFFTSNPIDQTGTFYIDARNSFVDCSRRFTAGFLITVEHTKADYDTDLINAKPNENIHFYEQTTDAATYNWQFGPNASTSVAVLPNPVTSFATVGPSNVTLDAVSPNGCHDIAPNIGPYIYNSSAIPNQECFNLINNGPDPMWSGHYNPFVAGVEPSADGFFSFGSYNEDNFQSTIGNDKTLNGKKGGYLCKYTADGILRWMVYTVAPAVSGTENYDSILSAAEDSQGNVYISGISGSYFYDTAHNRINLYTYTQNGFGRYFLIKLSSKGELIWRVQNDFMQITKVIVDQDDHVVLTLEGSHGAVPIYKDGVGSPPSGILASIVTTPASNFLICKLSPQGAIIWDANIELHGPNALFISDIDLDGQDNIYVMANFSNHGSFYSAGSSTPALSYDPPGAQSYSRPALVKYNTNGIFQWGMRTKNSDGQSGFDSTVTVYDIDVDDDGTVYMTGDNGATYEGSLTFDNTDGTTTVSPYGSFFIAKISASGICQWAEGASNSLAGYKLVKGENEIYAVGIAQTTNSPAVFSSRNGISCAYTSGVSDYFLVVYDLDGNLKRLIKSGENGYTAALFFPFTGFFKKDNNFYLSKDLWFYDSPQAPNYNEFGLSTSCLATKVGDVIRVKEDCGILIYDASLSTPSNYSETFAALNIVPNPTSNEFSIDLHQYYENVRVQLYDIMGQLISVQQANNVNKVTANVNGANGLYFVKLSSKDHEIWLKLIKS